MGRDARRELGGFPVALDEVLEEMKAECVSRLPRTVALEQVRFEASADVRDLLQTPAGATRQAAIAATIRDVKSTFAADASNRATRVWSQMVLERLVPAVPQLIGGSADLTGSNGTRTKLHTSVSRGDFAANYIHYGVREHAMAAAMNGMALHGGLIPYGATFLVFTDYCQIGRASCRERV